MATTGTSLRVRWRRRSARFFPRFFSSFSSRVTRSRARRRPISSFVSPGPRPPMPPVRRLSASSRWPSRGSVYFSCASSTCSLPSRVSARCAKMSRMSCVRSMTFRSVVAAIALACAGVRSQSKISVSMSCSMARITTSSSLPLPSTNLGSMRSRSWMTLSMTSTPAVSARLSSSARRASARRMAPARRFAPTWTSMARPSFARTSERRAWRANSASSEAMSSPKCGCSRP